MNTHLKRRENPDIWCVVVQVADGATASSTLASGDTVIACEGVRTLETFQLEHALQRASVSGKTNVGLEILRDGKLKRIEIPAGKLGVKLGYRWLTRQEAGEAVERYGDEVK
jgi:S1-C subfamily serine protease